VRLLISEVRDLKDKNRILEEKLKVYDENKKKNHHQMLSLEDKCKELKMKVHAAEGKQLGIEGAQGQFTIQSR
jgi:hypothetical protein